MTTKLKSRGQPALSLCEWELAIAAYAYEIVDRPIMSDQTFDALAKLVLVSNIPEFSADTGQWVHNLDLDLLSVVYHGCCNEHPKTQEISGATIQGVLAKLGIPHYCCASPTGCWRDYSGYVQQ